MNQLKLDLRARAELLAFLVESQLLARLVSGDWLTIGNVVELERIWLAANGGDADWFQRVSISSWSQTLAERVEVNLPVVLGVESAAGSENPRLDFRATFVRAVYDMCLDHLVEMGWFMNGRLRSRDGEAP
ncbi:conserved hypothetical protein [Paraburkholderia piptadeniae]|uniref:Uncharacterized protein n=1 Tax=Paraburkholderia piptadeniae TaxID=1701573 RepID=A0A1N7S9E8_9BURK|nr:hypothetical protein [Paraburkholderia piptadeniae]SIT43972.1 conserved hypothetical protein [Paraburkholderia piptadeniae]